MFLKFPPFTTYTSESDVETMFVSRGPIVIDLKLLQNIRHFHQYIFKQLNNLDDECTRLSEKDGYLVAPLVPNKQGEIKIHHSYLQDFLRLFQNSSTMPSCIPCKDYDYFSNRIIRKSNESADQTNRMRYYVVEVCHFMSPLTPFPDLNVAATFSEYYETRYNIKLNNDQPLLLVKHLPTQVNFFTPKTRLEVAHENIFDSKSNFEIHLVPELCSLLPLTVSSWALLRYLPTVAYRLETILRAHEMRLKIFMDAGLMATARKIKNKNTVVKSDQEVIINEENGENDRFIDENDFEDSLVLILKALTAKSVGQQFHSELLEVLGDSFLKFEVSLELFLRLPHKDEGILTTIRKHLVSNDMLSTQGRRLGIPAYISITCPDLTNCLLPPGFVLTQTSSKQYSLNLYSHQILGDKNVANTVEALISAILLSSGREAARKFLIWLHVCDLTAEKLHECYRNLNYHAMSDYDENTGEFDEVTQSTRSCCNLISTEQTNFKPLNNVISNNVIPNLEHVEKTLGYCFKNKLLLLHAVTHDSLPRVFAFVHESYERMEYLGDAILDFVVTRYICDNFAHLDHGDLTDLRSALVNNFTLAYLAVQVNLHQSLRHMSPVVFQLIYKFVEFLLNEKERQGYSWQVNAVLPSLIINCFHFFDFLLISFLKTSVDSFVVGPNDFEENLVEVPKILGDVFEALICAVFLDSNMNIDFVWDIFRPMFMPFIGKLPGPMNLDSTIRYIVTFFIQKDCYIYFTTMGALSSLN